MVDEEPKVERWSAKRKAAIILEALKGKISVLEACRKYGFTQANSASGRMNITAPARTRSRSRRKGFAQ
jgi:transposase-like protein